MSEKEEEDISTDSSTAQEQVLQESSAGGKRRDSVIGFVCGLVSALTIALASAAVQRLDERYFYFNDTYMINKGSDQQVKIYSITSDWYLY